MPSDWSYRGDRKSGSTIFSYKNQNQLIRSLPLSRAYPRAKSFNHGWTRMNPTRLAPQPRILDCGGNPAEREPRRFWTQPAVRKAVSPLRSSLRCASPRQAATAVQIFVVRARTRVIVLRIERAVSPKENSPGQTIPPCGGEPPWVHVTKLFQAL